MPKVPLSPLGKIDLDRAMDALDEVAKGFTAQTLLLRRVERERDSLARRLAHRFEAQSAATRLVEYALHVRMHGENAPGGAETWAHFDRAAEAFLRRFPSSSQPQDEYEKVPGLYLDAQSHSGAVFGTDAGPEWQHEGTCSWPEKPCTGHRTMIENDGKKT